MIGIFVDTTAIQQAFENIENSEAVVDELIGEAAAKVQLKMIELAPKSTHFLAHSIVMEFFPRGFAVYPTAPYTPFVEYGTGLFSRSPHLIFPTHAKALRWFSFGKPIFAKYIKGQKGQFFIKRTAEAVEGEVFTLAERLWINHHVVEG